MKKIYAFIPSIFTVIILCHGQANQKLSNLTSPTKINADLLPDSSGIRSVGINKKRWKNSFFNGSVFAFGSGGYGFGVSGAGDTGIIGKGKTLGMYSQGANTGMITRGSDYGLYAVGWGGDFGYYGTGVYAQAGIGGKGVYGRTEGGTGLAGEGYDGGVGVRGDGFYGVWAVADQNIEFGNNPTGLVAEGRYGVRATGSDRPGVYATSDEDYAGYFNGDVFASGVYVGSDQKLKQNVRDFTSAMGIINKLQPKQYEFRQDGNYKLMKLPKGTHFGLIAQNVETVLPSLVRETNFNTSASILTHEPQSQISTGKKVESQSEVVDFKAMNYTEFIPIVIKALQEISQKNTTLEQENDQLKSEYKKLETQMAELKQLINQNAKTASNSALAQNFPNPFTKSTTISFSIPKLAGTSSIVITETGSGKVIKTIPVSGSSQVTFDGSSLALGAYTYTLLVDGKQVDSKQMVITR